MSDQDLGGQVAMATGGQVASGARQSNASPQPVPRSSSRASTRQERGRRPARSSRTAAAHGAGADITRAEQPDAMTQEK
ncbi:hypothetical protein AB0H42_00355 [Nocardia sp. NPDC050799]|uniref:hypothetical protein n=1 Tax=Nocardia sp. NPDC050799 TaxID=3154842 RepID=UPI0033E10E4D